MSMLLFSTIWGIFTNYFLIISVIFCSLIVFPVFVYGQTLEDPSRSVILGLKSPTNTGFDSFGNLYVVDNGNNQIQKFDSEGNFILKWGTKGIQNGEFDCPNDIAIDSDDLIYITDNCNKRIQIFDTQGKFISKWGNPGTGNGYLNSPKGIILDSSNNVFVVDDSRSSIQKFTKTGEFISIWKTDREEVCPIHGTSSREPPCTIGIEDITIDSEGNFLIIKRLENSIEKISSKGVSLAKWDLRDENNRLIYPTGIAADSSDKIYVTAEGGRPFLYKFDDDGAFITKWLRKDTTKPFYVKGVSIDKNDNVYVSFVEINVVEKFTNQGKLMQKIGESKFVYSGFSVFPPSKQIEKGVPLKYVTCPENYKLVVNFKGSPACLKPESIPKLVNRGWVTNTVINDGMPIECYLEPNPGVCSAKETRYYFDLEDSTCKPFSWNGCRGTVPFETFIECESLCLH